MLLTGIIAAGYIFMFALFITLLIWCVLFKGYDSSLPGFITACDENMGNINNLVYEMKDYNKEA